MYGPDVHEARHVCLTAPCWPAGWSSEACASCRFCIAAGTSTATCRATCGNAVPRHRSADRPPCSTDLKQRGLLDDTLVVWGGEFGRTVYSQGTLTQDNYGRDHHPRNFCMWMAGGGIKGGHTLRRDRRLQLQHRRRTRARQRPERHDPALPGHRPRPLHASSSRGSTSA